MTIIRHETGWARWSAFVRQSIGFPVEVRADKPKKRRSTEANAYLWGVVYKAFTDALEGWDAEDVHEYLLGECFGWECIEGLGRKRLKPIRRSSRMKRDEFAKYVDFCIRKGAEHGVFIAERWEDREAA